MAPRAVILGCLGTSLSAEERRFFQDADPWGFILFARNVDTPEQVTRLTGALRDAVGWQAPIFVDQEGGRVQRFRDGFSELPTARWLGHQYDINPEEGRVVFFRSDETDHEVFISNTSRMSITGWLKTRKLV